jgi:WD40 repeat protein
VSGLLEIKSTDGSNFLLIASKDGTIAVLNLAKAYMENKDPAKFIVRRLSAHVEGVALMKFSAEKHIVLTAGLHRNDSDPSVFVWDTHPIEGMQQEAKAKMACTGR